MKSAGRRVFKRPLFRVRSAAIPALALVLLSAAGAGCRRTYGHQACRLERENVIATGSKEASALDLKALRGGGFALAWCMGRTTRLVVLGPALHVRAGPIEVVKNKAVISSEKVGDPGDKTFWRPQQAAPIKAADIALSELPSGAIAVATVESASSIRGGGAFIMKVNPDKPAEIVAKRVGGAGPHATTLSTALSGETLAMAWHEGRGNTSRIRIALLLTGDLSVSNESVLEVAGAVSYPHLLRYEDGLLMAYVQVLEGRRDDMSDIVLARLDTEGQLHGRSVIARSRFLAAEPRLVLGSLGPALVYRDDEERDGQAEYFFLPLTAQLKTLSPPARISRSDGYRGPRVVKKDDLFMAATIRSFQRSLLVGLNRFDAEGRKKGGEFQVYADGASFVRVDLVHQASETLLAYLEEKASRSRLLVSKVTCAEPVSP